MSLLKSKQLKPTRKRARVLEFGPLVIVVHKSPDYFWAGKLARRPSEISGRVLGLIRMPFSQLFLNSSCFMNECLKHPSFLHSRVWLNVTEKVVSTFCTYSLSGVHKYYVLIECSQQFLTAASEERISSLLM